MLNFELYWDDSGTDKQSPIAVAAAYVASKTQWEWFAKDWDRARQVEGFDYFHMTDFMAHPKHRQKPYSDWDEAKRNRVYFRLANIINTRVMMGFAAAVPRDEFEQSVTDRFRYEYASNHFVFAVKTCMGLVDQWHERYAKGEAVRYVFDRMGKGKGEIEDVWRMINQEPEAAARGGIVPGGYSFEDKKIFKPLQAADMLAWNQYAYQREILKGLPVERIFRPYYYALYHNRPMNRGFYRPGQVKGMFKMLEDYYREHGKQAYAVPKWKPPFE